MVKQPEISLLVHTLRGELRLTQEQFAHELGVTFVIVNRWENGRALPSPMALRLIEEKLAALGERGLVLRDRFLGDK